MYQSVLVGINGLKLQSASTISYEIRFNTPKEKTIFLKEDIQITCTEYIVLQFKFKKKCNLNFLQIQHVKDERLINPSIISNFIELISENCLICQT